MGREAPVRVGVVGDDACLAFVRRALTDAYTVVRFDDERDVAVVVLAFERSREPGLRERLPRSAGLVLVAERIESEEILAAATFGARELVLFDRPAQLQAAVDQAFEALRGGAPSVDMETELLRRVFDMTPNYVRIADAQGRFVLASQSMADFYATTVEELVGRSIEDFASPEEARIERDEDAEVSRTRRSRFTERSMADASGVTRRLQIIKRPLVLFGGSMVLVMSVAIDVTRRHRTELTLEKTNTFLKNVLETISEAVFALDRAGKFTFVNKRLIDLSGRAQAELVGTSLAKLFDIGSMFDVKRNIADVLSGEGATRHFEGTLAASEGEECVVSCSLLPLADEHGVSGVVGTAIDITARRAAERHIEHLAYHDQLTNLPNRRLLGDRLQMAISQARRDGRMVAAFMLDLNNFKAINESLGHLAGDVVLQELGARLRSCVREGDTLARMGSDEFVIAAASLGGRDEAAAIAGKLLHTVRQPFRVESHDVVVTAAMGVSVMGDAEIDADTLLRQADTALFECKRQHRDGWLFFTPTMSASSFERFQLEGDMRRGLRASEFELYYQPVVDLRTRAVVSAEALVRWNHPLRGFLMPGQFIELAEENGLIGALGEWVVFDAVRTIARWRRNGIRTVPIAVNVSAMQFEGNIVETVRTALEESDVEGSALTLEVTETLLVRSAAESDAKLSELKALGPAITIDDFGTGYSSLAYLNRFPIDGLKIDRSFMPADPSQPRDGAIAGAIISLAASMGLSVVAEGVETEAQRAFLIARGCPRAQGFLFARAMPAAAMEALLRGDSRDGLLAQHAGEQLPAAGERKFLDA